MPPIKGGFLFSNPLLAWQDGFRTFEWEKAIGTKIFFNKNFLTHSYILNFLCGGAYPYGDASFF